MSFDSLPLELLRIVRPSFVTTLHCGMYNKYYQMFELKRYATELTHMSAVIRRGLMPYFRHPPLRVGTFDRKLMKMIDRRNSH